MRKKAVIGIRREDKNQWEKRVPLVPTDAGTLIRDHGIKVIVQPSMGHRAFPDEHYLQAGACVQEDLSECDVIVGVKEIPAEKFLNDKAYIFFSHVIKGQSYNMPMLKTFLERGCTLIDYEKIEDENDIRLIFFGRYAGLAGMVETLHALGKRLDLEGTPNPFSKIKQPRFYASLEEIKKVVSDVGREIQKNGLPDFLKPFICGFTGYGNVSQGAQEIYDLLPVTEIDPESIRDGLESLPENGNSLYKVVFKEVNMFKPLDPAGKFDLHDYFNHPETYCSHFDDYLDKLTLLVNCIYWTEKCPKILTREHAKSMYGAGKKPRLRVVGDISCDIEGSVEVTLKATGLDNPMFVYNVDTGTVVDGVSGNGPVIMSIENLPCEIPVEASVDFSRVLVTFLPGIADADLSVPWESVVLAPPIKGAVIALKGELTPEYTYIKTFF